MACLAGRWRWLVKEHHVVGDRFPEGMASRACNLLMGTLERESRLFVIEKRGPPFVAVMAGGAVIGASTELVSMRVLVTLVARPGSTGEINMQHGQFHVRRLVAVGALDGAM